ncbi:hypothetical protein [Streptomyces sp. ALI-76-A]|uniref:hypothetical protein n=1 Tax=Streptomyces sp. ALI-76-A TaxID=3025736 RepID=UPI00256F6051|nr:hypothetical protein [Streptomyces sp. ALI-76-A]MDL5203597.1 hypothetical protein [Streptomyces sp. ALI-76-A]
MTSFLFRRRPRRTVPPLSARVAHTVLGGAAGIVWLVLPGMTITAGVPVPPGGAAADTVTSAAPAAPAGAAAQEDGTSAADLVLPLVVVGAAGALAGYAYVRRTRRARTRTTPGGSRAAPTTPPLSELDERSLTLLTEADDWIRTSREELGFAEAARSGAEAVAPFTRAVRDAESELSAAFRIRERYDDGVPVDEASRRHALTGVVGRCQEAGRRLDAEAAGLDRLRAPELESGKALAVAETRFRDLAGRTAVTEATLAELAGPYPPSAAAPVTGYVEQAKDRLVFATTRLNQARQAADLADPERAARHLRAAEGAVAQAAVLLTAVDRLADELGAAKALVPAALTGMEAALAGVRGRRSASAGLSSAEWHARIRRADTVLAAVRDEVAGGAYDPLDALRRIVRAAEPLGWGRDGVVSAAGLLVARSTTALADDFVAAHRGAVGAAARLRLARARRLLAADEHVAADGLAREARDLAEQDVRVHGNPLSGTAEHPSGVAGAALGGILLPGDVDGGTPPSFGGPGTRTRRAPEPRPGTD